MGVPVRVAVGGIGVAVSVGGTGVAMSGKSVEVDSAIGADSPLLQPFIKLKMTCVVIHILTQ
jgi:hypothetical protein